MDYRRRFQDILQFIEANLAEELSLDIIAKRGGYSLFHFHRIFHGTAGDSVMEYVRKRRLQCAGDELIDTQKRMIEIAHEYGFSSFEHFSRLFKRYFGVTPGDYRAGGVRIHRFKPVKLDREADVQVIDQNPSFVHLEDMWVAGLLMESSIAAILPKTFGIWRRFHELSPAIGNMIEPDVRYGFNGMEPGRVEEPKFRYMAAAAVSDLNSLPKEFTGRFIPASDYAVFQFSGDPVRIVEAYDAIYGRWFPDSGVELGENDDFERYDCQKHRNVPDLLECDIYIALKTMGEGENRS